ncbi:MAG: MarR family transcriptional regulator [Galbitalea sp.]
MTSIEGALDTASDTAEALALAATIRVGFGKLKRRLREEGGAAELTPSQASALGQLEKLGPSTVTELAQAEGVRPQSMGATIATLEAAGYIVGVPDPSDGRRTILSLSPMTVEKFSTNRAAREGWLFRVIQETLSPEEKRDLAKGFAVLGKLIES